MSDLEDELPDPVEMQACSLCGCSVDSPCLPGECHGVSRTGDPLGLCDHCVEMELA